MNMSYCRFSNTAIDFRDCLENLFSLDPSNTFSDNNTMKEIRSRKRLIEMAVQLIENLGGEVEIDMDEVNEMLAEGYEEDC